MPGVSSVALSAGGRWLAVGSRDATWRVTDVFSGAERGRSPEPNLVAQQVALAPGGGTLHARIGWEVVEFAVDSGEARRSRPGIVDALGYDAAGEIVLGARDGRRLAWSEGVRFESTVTALPGAGSIRAVERREGWSAAVDADGQAWAVADADGRPIKLPSATPIRAVRWLTDEGPPTLIALTVHRQLLRWVVAQPTITSLMTLAEAPRWLAAHDEGIIVAGARAGRVVDGRTGQILAAFEHDAPIEGVGFVKEQVRPWLAVVAGGTVRRSPPREAATDSGVVCGTCARLRDQMVMRYTTWHRTDGLLQTSTIQDGHHWPGLRRVARLGDGAIDAPQQPALHAPFPVRVAPGGDAVISQYSTVEQRVPLPGVTVVSALAGEVFLAGDQAGRLHRYQRLGHRRLTPRSAWLATSASSDGGRIAAATVGRMLVLEVATGEAVWLGEVAEATAGVALSADGAHVAHADTRGQVRVRDLATGDTARFGVSMPSKGTFVHRRVVMRWRPDGQALAVADRDGVLIWRADGPPRAIELAGRDTVQSLAWSNGTVIAAGHLTVWRVPEDGAAQVLFAVDSPMGKGPVSLGRVNRAVPDAAGAAVIVERSRRPALRIALPDGKPTPCTDATCPPRPEVIRGGYRDSPVAVAGGLTVLAPRSGGWAWTDGARFDCRGAACARVLVTAQDGPQIGADTPAARARRGWP